MLDLEFANVDKAQAWHKWHVPARSSVSLNLATYHWRALGHMLTAHSTVGAGVAKLVVFTDILHGQF